MIAIINDIHFGIRNDSKLFLDNQLKFFDEIFFPALIEHNIHTLYILGDVFDKRRGISFVILDAVYKHFFNRLNILRINVVILVGNHDCVYKTTNSINSPTLLLDKCYENVSVYTEHELIYSENQLISIMPWINPENIEASLNIIKNKEADILFGHFDIVGYMMHKNTMACIEGLDAKIFDAYDLVLSGHYHTKSTNPKHNIHYLGAPSQFTWSDANDVRGFHLLDLQRKNLTYIINPFNMFYTIHYDEGFCVDSYNYDQLENKYVQVILTEAPDENKFNLFLNRIHEHNPYEVSVIDNTEFVVNTDFDINSIETEDTVQIVDTYIANTEYTVDKNRLIKMFRRLYSESLT
jgi:DNA repair exonuclease SbcCD nuclease subunit